MSRQVQAFPPFVSTPLQLLRVPGDNFDSIVFDHRKPELSEKIKTVLACFRPSRANPRAIFDKARRTGILIMSPRNRELERAFGCWVSVAGIPYVCVENKKNGLCIVDINTPEHYGFTFETRLRIAQAMAEYLHLYSPRRYLPRPQLRGYTNGESGFRAYGVDPNEALDLAQILLHIGMNEAVFCCNGWNDIIELNSHFPDDHPARLKIPIQHFMTANRRKPMFDWLF